MGVRQLGAKIERITEQTIEWREGRRKVSV